MARVKADDSYNPFAKFTENFDAITKEGKEIKLPEDYAVNQATGEVEDLSKHILGSTEKANPNFYDEVEEVATKKPSKEVQELIDYVEEEKMFNDFNESIGDESRLSPE